VIPAGVREGRLRAGQVTLRVLEAGKGEPVLLLHGFPQSAEAWLRQLPPLAAAGFHAVAPELRGYGGSDRPRGVRSYAVSRLVDDAVGLLDTIGASRASVVGHDWGGVVAWALAARHPERVRRLVVINAPHPARFRQLLRTPDQLRRSWYAFLFQLPILPELLLRRRRFAAIRAVFRHGPRAPDVFSREEVESFVAALRPPGALTAALNYYRAMGRAAVGLATRRKRSGAAAGGDAGAGGLPGSRVEAPTLLIWGDDPHLSPRNTEGLERWVPRLEILRFPGATHWLPAEEPEALSAALLEFLGRTGP
jgi:epoxide hydrolase 4